MNHADYKVRSIHRENLWNIDENYGQLYKVKNTCLHFGNYLTKDSDIFLETLHENYGKKWLKYWLKERGDVFGGINADQLLISNKGRNIKLTKRQVKWKEIDSPVFLFQYMYDHNFHHFIVSSLPKLAHMVGRKNVNAKVLLCISTPLYQKQFVEAAIGKSRVLYIDSRIGYILKTVYIAPFPQKNGMTGVVKFYDFLASSVCKNTPFIDSKKGVYLSRRDSEGKRPLLNMASVEKIFFENGIELRQMSKISLVDRIELIRSSKSIAGIFGAGFANIVFASRGSRILFICHPAYGIPAEYLEICRIKNISLKVYSEYRIFNKAIHILNRFIFKVKKPTNKHNINGWKINLLKLERTIKSFYLKKG